MIRRTLLSADDYSDIYDYIARDNPSAAIRMLEEFDRVLGLLEMMPKMGPVRSDLGEGTRTYPVQPYLLIYREISGGVELLRVMHGARDIKAELGS